MLIILGRSLYLALFLVSSVLSSFIDRDTLRHVSDPDERVEMAAEYLQRFAQLLLTHSTRNSSTFASALRVYQRGLKKDFLQSIRSNERAVQKTLVDGDEEDLDSIQIILEKFAECAASLPKSSSQFGSTEHFGERGRRRSGGRPRRSQADDDCMRLVECAEDAELELVESIYGLRKDIYRENGGGREERKAVRIAGDNATKIKRIIDVSHGNVVRWPWLTDEGWTWPWILGLLGVLVVMMGVLAAAGWFAYQFFRHRSRDKWGERSEERAEYVH